MTTHDLAKALLKKDNMLMMISNFNGEPNEAHLLDETHIENITASNGDDVVVLLYDSNCVK